MDKEESLDEELASLSRRCWKTSKARFEAARRMRRCCNASTLCVAMLSLEIIIINLLIFIPSLSLDGDLVTIITVCLSAFVLVLSLIIAQLKYDKREEEYHKCGMLLSALERRMTVFIASKKERSYETVLNFEKKYQEILRQSNLNHTKVDWEHAIIADKSIHENLKHPCWYKLGLMIRWHLLRSDSIYHLLTVLGAVAIILVALYGRETHKGVSDTTQETNLLYFK